MRKLVKNIENDECEDEGNVDQKENQEQVAQAKPKRTMRGKTAALARLAKNDDDEDEEIKGTKGGVYATQISQTKKEAQNIHKNFEDVDSKLSILKTILNWNWNAQWK